VKPVVLGSRGSALALAQTKLVMAELRRAWPDREFEIRIIKTQGDRLSEQPDSPFNQPLGKGLFTAELERALLKQEIDLAVHSLKDLPTSNTEGLALAAIPKRADARDVLITPGAKQLDELPAGAVIATGSPRRAAQLKLARNDLQTADIRGNIDTRIRKFRENAGWSGLILAAAGLERLQPDISGLTITPLPFSLMLPAPGQGALALQIRADAGDIPKIVRVMHDPATAAQVAAERAFLQALGGGCQQPIAAYAEIEADNRLNLCGIAWLGEETEPRRGQQFGSFEQAETLGRALAEEIAR
jgi:hydroxymethylbilane synthase